MKSRQKLSKNFSIHGKNCEISGPYNFWTSIKSCIPDVWNWNCWTLFGLEIKVGGPCPPLAHGGYAPAFKGLSVVSNCLRPESEPLMSETKVDKLACKHRYTHTLHEVIHICFWFILIYPFSGMLFFTVEMQNICNLTDQNSVHISDIFNCYSANISVTWSTRKLDGKYKLMCKYRIDQHLIVLNLYSISINIILVLEFMTAKVSHNLNSMQEMSTKWNCCFVQTLLCAILAKILLICHILVLFHSLKYHKISCKIWETRIIFPFCTRQRAITTSYLLII